MPRISQLPDANLPLSGSELVPVVQGGATKHAPMSAFGRGVANVLDYGAKGDGVTDDTTAIQACLTAAGGNARVLIPDRATPYVISNVLNVPSNTHVSIEGTLFIKAGTAGNMNMLAFSGDNVRIDGGGTLDGNKANQSSAVHCGIGSSVGSRHANLSVSDLTIKNTWSWPINIVSCDNVLVQNVLCQNGGNSTEFSDCTNARFDHCIVADTQDYGIAIYGGGCQRCAVTNCTVYGSTAGGITVLADVGQPVPCQNTLIANNICYNNEAWGISVLRTGSGSPPHIGVQILDNICVANQTYASGGPLRSEILVSSCRHALIQGNYIADSVGPSAIGVCVAADAIYIKVNDNFIRNIGSDALGTGVSVEGSPHPPYLTLSDNFIEDDRGPSRMAYAINFTGGVAPGLRNVVVNNGYTNMLAASPVNVPAGAPDLIYNERRDGSGATRWFSANTFSWSPAINQVSGFEASGLTIGWNRSGTEGEVEFLLGRGIGAPGGLRCLAVDPTGALENGNAPIWSLTKEGVVAENTDPSVTATGSNQATAYVISKPITVFATTPSGTGAVLRSGLPFGSGVTVYNRGANALLVYPQVGASVDNGGTNAPVSIASAGSRQFHYVSANSWMSR